jgi:hypothetical protein
MNKLLMILMLSVAFVFSVNAQSSNYVGNYEFSEDGGKTAGGTAVFVGHGLKIKSDGTAIVTADGYQTSKHIIAKTKMVGKKMQLIFEKYDAENHAGPETLSEGDLLLTIEWKTVKGKKVLWTTFDKHTPSVFDAKKGGGIYFKKSKG